MNPIVFALRRPITVMMLVLALALGGLFSVFEMQKDIFPALNQPQLYVIHNYGGMDPKQIEGLITNVYELFFQYINGVEHVESRSIQSMVMLKLFFQPGIDMAEATAQTGDPLRSRGSSFILVDPRDAVAELPDQQVGNLIAVDIANEKRGMADRGVDRFTGRLDSNGVLPAHATSADHRHRLGGNPRIVAGLTAGMVPSALF